MGSYHMSPPCFWTICLVIYSASPCLRNSPHFSRRSEKTYVASRFFHTHHSRYFLRFSPSYFINLKRRWKKHLVLCNTDYSLNNRMTDPDPPARHHMGCYVRSLLLAAFYSFDVESADFGCQRSCNASIFLLCVRTTTSSPFCSFVPCSASPNRSSR